MTLAELRELAEGSRCNGNFDPDVIAQLVAVVQAADRMRPDCDSRLFCAFVFDKEHAKLTDLLEKA